MLFRELEVGQVVICNGVAMRKINPKFKNGQYYNAEGPDGQLYYIADDGKNVIEEDI